MKLFLNSLIMFTCASVLSGCGEETIDKSAVIELETPTDAIGDGTSTYKIKATLDPKSDKTLRKVIFKTSHGSFIEAPATDPMKVTVDAKMFNEVLFAEVTWKVPARKGEVEISVEPGADDLSGLYLEKAIVNVDTSVVRTINLSASSFSVLNGFNSEIVLTGVLMNEFKNGVSSGIKVLIEDHYLSGQPVNGRFRNSQLSSNASSTVSTIYSPGPIEPNQDIILTATVLDQQGNKTGISSAIKIYVNKPN